MEKVKATTPVLDGTEIYDPVTEPAPLSITVIKPDPSTHGKVVKLSAIDQIAPRDYVSMCLFFKLPRNADIRRVFRTLKIALLNTVNDIPELACCVQECTDNGRKEVELLFDADKGTEIHFKDYTSPELADLWKFGSFEQLEREHFPLNKMPRHIIFGTSAKLTGGARLPCLVVQANFVPGGLILGSCMHVSTNHTGFFVDFNNVHICPCHRKKGTVSGS